MKSYNINEFKKAVWQYLLEHRHFKIDDIIKSKRRFWGKIAARRKGYKKRIKRTNPIMTPKQTKTEEILKEFVKITPVWYEELLDEIKLSFPFKSLKLDS